ncbi:SDR family NAD(P)-dependent oxidoreductase [Zhouia sp. PK063]|uniref:SDR family NAD(P)-dependent oxidoreductase n=1 Tax=Zhouia sp. PK063 TaxID=3373602 RepID=UPI00379D5555
MKTILITGASKGLGLFISQYLLEKGNRVIGTSRKYSYFEQELLEHNHFVGVEMDLTDAVKVQERLNNLYDKYGAIDVLINNAGYGFVGGIEETTDQELHDVIETNVVAGLRLIRYILPQMRQKGKGYILNISSMAGLLSAAGWGIYNLSKYAVEGYTEALYHEVKEFGIGVTLLEPGAFRTKFLDSSLQMASCQLPAYENTVGERRIRLKKNNGKQPNDPKKLAEAVWNLIQMEKPPLRLLLGKDAFANASKKIELLQRDFNNMKEITFSTNI